MQSSRLLYLTTLTTSLIVSWLEFIHPLRLRKVLEWFGEEVFNVGEKWLCTTQLGRITSDNQFCLALVQEVAGTKDLAVVCTSVSTTMYLCMTFPRIFIQLPPPWKIPETKCFHSKWTREGWLRSNIQALAVEKYVYNSLQLYFLVSRAFK